MQILPLTHILQMYERMYMQLLSAFLKTCCFWLLVIRFPNLLYTCMSVCACLSPLDIKLFVLTLRAFRWASTPCSHQHLKMVVQSAMWTWLWSKPCPKWQTEICSSVHQWGECASTQRIASVRTCAHKRDWPRRIRSFSVPWVHVWP